MGGLISSKRSFTLVELIIVIIIVGILAALGLTQYNQVVEKSRTTEAKVRIGVMRDLAYEYYLNNGDMSGMTDSDVGAVGSCSTAGGYYWYQAWVASTYVSLAAVRCTSGGKPPDASKGYVYYLSYYPSTGQSSWHCYYSGDGSGCFGLSP
ncbi:MAG: prepilin-type N-terminal cleavage/methylation domain-containing protein [Candidatus Omnitrophica bacterium]|jgi:prepilin-type N-terminal cleavage/methylation domain-containing protein|nr:prepilin-type N-terminal cleavage/methylation domain-containing protein [Candidatus Omnitrophota bacterium]MDD3274984.1 prepilin-type N-terminal cleavage/methylation domain-containing protein [Candidatus Omnitrophota bacterium]MDD5077652.1 prepilin-type N-terminal cleavage/methylation domain-containing protein [Candidatus Omnitrophota bacterium]MDD5724984.1 prepilin-type N-terminal cleavage/methylation domain-containing protein [Candidatus Omnitrophota bacterium]